MRRWAFADVDPVTGNITVETVKAAVEAASFKVRVYCRCSFRRSALRPSCELVFMQNQLTHILLRMPVMRL